MTSSIGKDIIHAALINIRLRLFRLGRIIRTTPRRCDRTVDTGVLENPLANQYAAGGYIALLPAEPSTSAGLCVSAAMPVSRFDVPA